MFYSEVTFIIGDNWGAVLAENWSDGDFESEVPNAPRGFPSHIPQFENQPEFEWIQRNAKTPRDRRLDFLRSITPLTSLTENRRPGLGRKDIDPDIYLRRQDEESRRIGRSGFSLEKYGKPFLGKINF